LGITQAEDKGKNFYGIEKPFYIEFDHLGGEISIFEPEIEGSDYSNNRKLNNVAPTFNLYKMSPVYVSGSGDGKYNLTNLTNPFNYPATLNIKGKADNQIFLNGVQYSDYDKNFSDVDITLQNILVNGIVKMEILTRQDDSLNADFAKFEGTITWTSSQDIPTTLGIDAEIQWTSVCNPQYYGTSIEDCNACNDCGVEAESKSTIVTCGKVSGDKTININFSKNISDRSVYRTFYVYLINNQNNWQFI
jgi:hypothetical protein